MRFVGFLLMFIFLIVSGNSIYISNDVIFDPIYADIIYKFEMNPTSSICVGTTDITIDGDMLKTIPNTGNLNGTIYDWETTGITYKSFNLTNISSVDNVDIIVGGYSSSSNVNLYKDTILNSTIISNTTGYLNFTHYGFSSINFTLSATETDITDCATLDSPHTTYYLTQDIIDSSTSNCIDITANHVTLDCQGHTIDGDDSASSYGIYISRATKTTTNITINNCTITDWYYGIYMDNSDLNIINDTTCSSCTIGSTLSKSDNNIIDDSQFSSNVRGFWLADNSNDNYLYNSIINDNEEGIYIQRISLQYPSNCYIYNNLFNNTDNYDDSLVIYEVYFNTTKQTGTRIYSLGTQIGGNYWTNSTGNDYSDTCVDADYDGFCDSTYTVDTGVYDYLPLSKLYNYIVIVLPENTTYGTKDLTLNWTSTLNTIDANYSLNGNINITLMNGGNIKNVTLNSSQLLIGNNNVTIFIKDDNSDTYQLIRYFSLESNPPTWRNLIYDDLAILNYDNTITINVTDDYDTINNVTVEHNGINYTGTNVSDIWTIIYNMTSIGDITDTIWMEDVVGNINSTTFTYNGADINITYANQSEEYMMPNATGYTGMYPMRYNPPITIFYNNGNGSDIYVDVTINTTVNSCLEFYLYNKSISSNSVKYQAYKFTSPSTTYTVVESLSNNTNITIYGWCDFINCVSGNSYYYDYWFDFYSK